MIGKEIISLSEFKADASAWMERIQHQPPVILTQNGRGRAVIQSYDEYQRTQFELALLTRLNRALADLSAGKTSPHEEVVTEARTRLRRRLAERGD